MLPRFLCGLETVTNFPHAGVRCLGSKGCLMELPYWCPADHVLRMHYLAGVMPQRMQVPLRYAEHSLLLHRLAPAATLASRVDVALESASAPAAACARCGDSGYATPRPPLPPAARAIRVSGGAMSEAPAIDLAGSEQTASDGSGQKPSAPLAACSAILVGCEWVREAATRSSARSGMPAAAPSRTCQQV